MLCFGFRSLFINNWGTADRDEGVGELYSHKANKEVYRQDVFAASVDLAAADLGARLICTVVYSILKHHQKDASLKHKVLKQHT